jgi:hypothetical protein
LAALTIPQPRPIQAAGSAPVIVTNTPLPVSLSGTGNAAGTVNIASLPAVQLAAGTTVGISSGIGNTETTPLFISDVENSARQALAVDIEGDTSSGGDCTLPGFCYSPGVGKRFVIEQVSGLCGTNPDQLDDVGFTLRVFSNGDFHSYYFSGPSHVYSRFTTLTRIYADGDSSEAVSMSEAAAGSVCSATLSGHLITIPTTFPTAPLTPSNGGTGLAK